MGKRILTAIITALILLFSGCDVLNDNGNNITIDITKPVILLSYVSDNYSSELQLVNGDNVYNLFLDEVNRSYPSLSLDKSKIVYLHDFAFFPMVATLGNPSVKYYDFISSSEIEILPKTDNVIYMNPVWISESRISVEKMAGNLLSLIIVNIDGSIISEKEISTNYSFDQYVSPDKDYILLTTDSLKLYDIAHDSVISINSDIKYSSKPIFHNNGFYFNAESGCKYYDLITNRLIDYNITGDLCFINNTVLITKDNDYFKLLDMNSNLIGSVYLENCKYYGNLQTFQDSLFYFYGENKLIDDEDAVYKVDFEYSYIEKLTDNGPNTFIMSINSFK